MERVTSCLRLRVVAVTFRVSHLGQFLRCGGHLGLQDLLVILGGPQGVAPLGQLPTQADAVLPETGQLRILSTGGGGGSETGPVVWVQGVSEDGVLLLQPGQLSAGTGLQLLLQTPDLWRSTANT